MTVARTILVFDTDPTSREAIVQALRDEGHGVLSTGDGHDAMELCEDCRVDLALVEWASEELDGLEVACRAKGQGGFVPVIWLSPLERADAISGFVRSTDGFLSRPIDSDQLLFHVRGLLAAREAFERLQTGGKDLLAVTDGLTGLYNRRFFGERLRGELLHCRDEGGTLSLLAFDVDDLKAVNVGHGYKAGDEVLRTVAALLRRGLRGMDTVCRFGGDEFVAILPQTDGVGAALAADRLRASVAVHTFRVAGPGGAVELHLTVSAGVAMSAEVGHDAEALVKLADDALQAARGGGRNKVVWGGR